MSQLNVARVAFNRGQVSPLALARTDIERVELSAEEQTNFVPRVLGSMSLRPGWKYLGSTLSDSQAFLIPFIKSTDDTAFVEFTNQSLRVWEDDAPITRNAVSTTIRGGDFSADITNWNKLTDPTLFGSSGASVAFSPDGQYVAFGHSGADNTGTSFNLSVYAISGTTFTPLATAPSAPLGSGLGVAFSPDSQLLTVAHDTSTPFVKNYYLASGSGTSTIWTALSAPASLPAGNGRGCAYSPDGQFMAIAHDTSPFVTIYQISGTGSGTTYTKLTNPSSLPAGNGSGVAFSQDSQFMAVAHTTSPFVTIYQINGTTFTKLSNPASLPASDGKGVAFSRDGNWMAVAHTTTPFVTIYSISGTTFTKATNPATLPDGNGTGVAFSSDNQFLAVSHATTQFITLYRNISGTWTKQTDPGTLPAGNANGVAFSGNNRYLAVAHATTPFITIYEAYQWLDMDSTGAASTYAGISSSWVQSSSWATDTSASGGSDDYTLRQVIDANQLTTSGSKVRITIKTTNATSITVGACFIGERAALGDNYDFASAPTRITWNGGNSSVSGNLTAGKLSDEISFAIDETKHYVIAFYIATAFNNIVAKNITGGNTQAYFKLNVNEASVVNASGYTTHTNDVIFLDKLEVYETTGSNSFSGLSLVGTNYNDARRTQAVSVLNADKTTEHGIRLTVAQGQVKFQVGTGFGEDDLITQRTLGPGVYSFAFTPNANLFFVDISSFTKYSTIISSCQIDGGGDLTLGTPYTTSDLSLIRHAQSGDIIYLACQDIEQQKLLRFGSHSWGIADYLPEDGPFRELNGDFTTLTASALTGDITLTASKNYFKSEMVGTLFRISSVGQATDDSFTGANQFSENIKVTGVGTTRDLSVVRSGTWSATITLQRSIGEPGTWVDVATFTSNGTATYNDALDNQIIYYRIGIKTGNYTSGTADVALSYASGSANGIARVTSYTSPTVVNAIVLDAMGGTSAFETWSEGIWSDYRGWPSSVAIYEGRLAWAGNDKIILSESDGYEDFDDTVEGDSGPIVRSIGEGPVDDIQWLLPLQRLIAGAEGSELSIRSNSFDEPLTPSNFNMKACSTQGSAPIGAVRIDSNGAFVERSGTRVYQLRYNYDTYDYSSSDFTKLAPDLCQAGIKKIVLQRHPDTRLHCILNDGTVAMLVFDQDEDVICWIKIETDGDVEDAVILPQEQLEDAVYYVVNRTINSLTKRYVEKWALQTECEGGTSNKQADAFLAFTNAPASATVTGLDHLEGEAVVVWADGKCLTDSNGDIATFTVSSGAISLTNDGNAYSASAGIVGLPYTGQYKSTKLAYAAQHGTALNQRKRIEKIGLILYKTHHKGLKVGDSYDFLRGLPTVLNNKAVVADTIHSEFDYDHNAYNTTWSPDARLCMKAFAPRPVTVLAATMVINTNG